MSGFEPTRKWRRLIGLLGGVLTFAAVLAGADWNWNLPPGFPRPQTPPDNPMTAAKVEFGRYLFYDKRMSVNGKQSCGGCHRQDLAFTDGRATRFEGGASSARDMGAYFNTGVGNYEAPNRGLFERTGKPEDIGKFRAPTLRNIAVTAPYMHDGSIATLEEVIDHYAAGGRFTHPNKSSALRPFQFTRQEKQDLIAFLHSLTDEELLHDRRWSDPWPK